MKKVKIVKYANPAVSVHSLTIGEAEKRRAMLKAIREKLKAEMSREAYLEASYVLGEMFF